jgi:hypothetical protein
MNVLACYLFNSIKGVTGFGGCESLLSVVVGFLDHFAV